MASGTEPKIRRRRCATRFTYNADGRTLTITAENATTGDQTTGYGTTLTVSEIASNDLLVSETYPDSTGGSDKVTYTYNRQGQQNTKQDQNGPQFRLRQAGPPNAGPYYDAGHGHRCRRSPHRRQLRIAWAGRKDLRQRRHPTLASI